MGGSDRLPCRPSLNWTGLGCDNIYEEAYLSSKAYYSVARYMANSVCAPIFVEHAHKQSLSTTLDIRYKLACSQALCAHMRADYARARILYTMMLPDYRQSQSCTFFYFSIFCLFGVI